MYPEILVKASEFPSFAEAKSESSSDFDKLRKSIFLSPICH
jgi:hypothetical protein